MGLPIGVDDHAHGRSGILRRQTMLTRMSRRLVLGVFALFIYACSQSAGPPTSVFRPDAGNPADATGTPGDDGPGDDGSGNQPPFILLGDDASADGQDAQATGD